MGRPKAWLPFGDETLLQRTARRVGEAAWPIVVVAAPDQDLPPLPPEILVVRDPVEGRGPLQGIAVGLGAMEGLAAAAFVSSTDAPFIEPALIRRLAALRSGGFDVVVPRAEDHHHPLCAVYACSVHSEAEALLAANRPRPFFLFERVRTLVAEAPLLLEDPELAAVDPALRSLRNLNTPDDYEAALREAGIAR
jgi:molybdopterin-guanine dinucleotide biosynthesis protein A